MYQLRSQIDLFYPYKCNTGVFTGAQFYLNGKKRVPEAFFCRSTSNSGWKKYTMQRSSPEYVPCYLIFDIANDIYQFCRFTGFIKIDNFVNVGDYLLCLRMQTRNPEFHLWEHLPEGEE